MKLIYKFIPLVAAMMVMSCSANSQQSQGDSKIHVESVSIDQDNITMYEGDEYRLTATISPDKATEKTLNWTSSNKLIATVNQNGVVTALKDGQTVITASSVDGNKSDTCAIRVEKPQVSSFTIEFNTNNNDGNYQLSDIFGQVKSGSEYISSSSLSYVYAGTDGLKFSSRNNSGSALINLSETYTIKTITAVAKAYVSSSNHRVDSGTLEINDKAQTINNENAKEFVFEYDGLETNKIEIECSKRAYIKSLTIECGTKEPINPISISINSDVELSPGSSKQLEVSYLPRTANQNKQITWEKASGASTISINSNGVVSVASNATSGQSAVIRASLTNIPSATPATCSVTVVETPKAAHTVLIYMCGSDLESKYQLATSDIQEILSVSGQPDDVNIIIQTGGAKSWASTYGISSSNLERYEVRGKKLNKLASLSYQSMGLTSTLQSFVEFGLKNYPADKTGLVLWNHGGGMRGVCYDEKKSDDNLITSELSKAVGNALSTCGMSGQKLEWIGYDACLMQVQDIAEVNSKYFNYMIASQESESGYGWDYDTWVDDLYAKKDTKTILKAVVDGFIADNGGANATQIYDSGQYYDADQTLSVLDLSKVDTYKTAWENMATQLKTKLTSSNRSSFNTMIKNNVKHFAGDDYDYFCTFDAKDFMNVLASNSTFNPGSSYTNAVINAFNDLVYYNVAQKGAGNAYGLCFYWTNSTSYSDIDTYYSTSETNFTTWRSICSTYGYHC